MDRLLTFNSNKKVFKTIIP